MSPHRQVPCPCPSVCGSIRTLGLFIFSAAEPHAQPKPTALPPCRLADSSVRSAIVADTSTARRRVSRPHSSALNSARPVERCDWLFLLEEGPRLPEPGAGRSEPGAGRSSSAVWMPSPPLTAPEGTPTPTPQTHTPGTFKQWQKAQARPASRSPSRTFAVLQRTAPRSSGRGSRPLDWDQKTRLLTRFLVCLTGDSQPSHLPSVGLRLLQD